MIAQILIETVGTTKKCPTTTIKVANDINLKVIPRAVAGSLGIWKFDQSVSERFIADTKMPYRKNWTVMKAFKKKTASINQGWQSHSIALMTTISARLAAVTE